MKTATVNTVQGIGDLIWVYRKLSNHFDKMNFNILCVSQDAIQKRAEAFVKLLPKCGDVSYKVVKPSEYNALAKKRCLIDDRETFDYSVNAWLESGIHLDSIDEHPVNWDLGISPKQVDLPNKYLLVYISGCSHNYGFYQMRNKQWSELIVSTAIHKNIERVIFIGAPFDKVVLNEVAASVSQKLSCSVYTDMHITQSIWIIKNAEYFISYQSGLCMLAEEFGTKTFMLWFPDLAPMTSAWIRRKHLESGLFKHGFFGMDLKTMIDVVKK